MVIAWLHRPTRRKSRSLVEFWKSLDGLSVAWVMQVKSITYAMLRVTKQFENDRVEVTLEVQKGDKLGDVVREAKRVCYAALGCEVDTYETIYATTKTTPKR